MKSFRGIIFIFCMVALVLFSCPNNGLPPESEPTGIPQLNPTATPQSQVSTPPGEPTVPPTPTPEPAALPTPTHVPTLAPIVTGMGTVSLLPREQTVTTGSDFITTVYLDSGTDKVAAYGFKLYYPPTIMEIDTTVGDNGVEAGTNGFVAAVNSDIPGEVTPTGFDVAGKGPEADLHLLTVHWKAVSAGTAIINLSVNSLTNENLSTIGTPQANACMVIVEP